MVPSDLSNNSASFRHARLKLCNPGVRPLCLFAPLAGLSPDSDQRSKARQVVTLQIGTCSSERPFALKKRLPASGPPFNGQCSWPIPSARYQVFSEPVRSYCSSPPPGLPQPAQIHHSGPVARFPLGNPGRPSDFHSRLGPFDPSRSKRKSEYQPRSSPHRIARFPSLPAACFLKRFSSGSMLGTRYAPFGLLSNKPLGTFFTMLLNRFSVN
jgi:hypothetical protein